MTIRRVTVNAQTVGSEKWDRGLWGHSRLKLGTVISAY